MNPTHLHLILNHIPVLGVPFGLALLLYAGWRRRAELAQVALGIMVLAAVVAIPVFTTGEPAEETVEGIAGVSKSTVERHEQAAMIALVCVEAVGALSLIGLIFNMRRKAIPPALTVLIAASALVAAIALAWAANLGGRIRHTEIDAAPQATIAGDHED